MPDPASTACRFSRRSRGGSSSSIRPGATPALRLRACSLPAPDIVGGVALGRGGQTMDGVPLFDRVADLPAANVALVYTPPEGFRDAVRNASPARIRTIVGVAEHVPVHDALEVAARARASGCWLIGPNTLGVFVPGRGLLGSIAPSFCRPGRVGVDLAQRHARARHGAAIVGGRDRPEPGRPYRRRHGDRAKSRRVHRGPRRSDATDAVLYCGEIGGDKEYALAQAARGFRKPVVAMVIGRHAPVAKRMGHAGALIGSARESADAKLAALAAAGCRTAVGPVQAIAILDELGLARR